MRRRPYAERLRAALKGCESRQATNRLLERLSATERQALAADWQIWARDDQLPPIGDWATWLLLGGRGAGKTRAGAEWVRGVALGLDGFADEPAMRIALVGETLDDVRRVMIEGESGLLSVHTDKDRPRFESSKRQLVWPNGAVAQLFSGIKPDMLRGPQFEAAWCDELCKWRYPGETWDMLQFALRLGEVKTRQIVTTTPRPIPLLKRLMAEEGTVVDSAATDANRAFLAPGFIEKLERQYGGTRLGRQEMLAEILEDREDALWNRRALDALRIDQAPELQRVVVAVDPPATSGKRADACGIVVAGLGADGLAYVLADETRQQASPLRWARAAVNAYHGFEADRLIAESNQGGEMVESVVRQVEPELPVKLVRASRGKYARAEPVAALYEQGRVRHVGSLPLLEDEMCDFGLDGLSSGRSPDRLDALVWALTELMLGRRGEPRVRRL